MKKTILFVTLCSLLAFIPNSKAYSRNNHKPPINCPLEKQGVNVHGMKPFQDTEKYIEFLEKKERAAWQKPDEVISAMKLRGSEVIADVGAGSGYFSFRFSKALPGGKVYAIDIDPGMLRHIHHKSLSGERGNIDVILATGDDPKVPGNADIVFICDVLHHVENRSHWLLKLYSEMKKDSHLILVEFKEGKLPQGPPEHMKISGKEMVTLVARAGFDLVKKDSRLLPYQNYFEFVKK